MPLITSPEFKKILIRGGSIPAGVATSRSYVDILKEFSAPQGVEVINRSRPGETSFDGVETFREDVEPFRPDVLVIHFGIDDAFAAVYRSEFKENLVRMVKMARSCSITRIFIATSQPFENRFDMDSAEIFYRVIREVCSDLDCVLIPVHTFWAGVITLESIPLSDLVQEDPRLPNEKGHELFALAFLRYLNI